MTTMLIVFTLVLVACRCSYFGTATGQFPGYQSKASVKAGHSCKILSRGSMKCWGIPGNLPGYAGMMGMGYGAGVGTCVPFREPINLSRGVNGTAIALDVSASSYYYYTSQATGITNCVIFTTENEYVSSDGTTIYEAIANGEIIGGELKCWVRSF